MDTQERLTHIDNERMPVVMIPEDVALFLRKSVSWVYKHWRELSGVKIGGSIIFPDKETLYEHLFRRKEGGGGTTSPRRGSGTQTSGTKPKRTQIEQRQKGRRKS